MQRTFVIAPVGLPHQELASGNLHQIAGSHVLSLALLNKLNSLELTGSFGSYHPL